MTAPGAVAKHARPSPNPRSRMSDADLARTIDAAWEDRAKVDASTKGPVREAVEEALQLLYDGRARVAEKDASAWRVIQGGPGGAAWWDKVASKFQGWGENRFRAAGFRAVPGAIVRRGAYVGPNVVLMPSFVNLGAYVGEGTMVDTWATVGSCAQIGKNCHLSGGVGIGGVLEPLQANPTIIEDNCFVGARSEVVEGVVVGEGSVLSMAVFPPAPPKIMDREPGEISGGKVPPYSAVVPGSLRGKPLPDGSPGPSLACAVIVKRVDAQTRAKTSINDLLRD